MSVLERTILSARWVVGQTGFIAATIAYLQAISSDEARELAATDEQLGYAIGAHQTLYAHNLTIQIASILDNGRRTIALREVEALQRAKPVALDEVFRYAASQHRDVGIELSRERFDRNVALVATMAKELRKTSHYVSVEKFRNGGVAHLTLQDYRVSFAEMAETAHELFQISGALQFLFKSLTRNRESCITPWQFYATRA